MRKTRHFELAARSKYWDGIACELESKCAFPYEDFLKNVSKDAIILDMGCGQGRILEWCYRRGYHHMVGLDWSQRMLLIASNRTSQVPFVMGDCRRVPFKDGTFDACIMSALLTTQALDTDLARIVTEAHRILKQGGQLFISDFLITNNLRNIKRYLWGWIHYKKWGCFEIERNLVMRHFTLQSLYSLFSLSGFLVRHMLEIPTRTFRGNQARGVLLIAEKI